MPSPHIRPSLLPPPPPLHPPPPTLQSKYKCNSASLLIFLTHPQLCTIQLLTSFYPTGKTSIASRLNLPGRFAWITMELPSPVLLVVTVLGVSWQTTTPLPWPHVLLMAMFLVHYTNRALVGPLLNPIMSPMHLLIWALGIAFNCINPVLIGGWLGGYGKVHTSRYTFLLGSAIWAVGFTGNLYHESILRQIRAEDANFSRTPEKRKGENRVSNGSHVRVVDGRVYIIPRGGLFEYVLFPHVPLPSNPSWY